MTQVVESQRISAAVAGDGGQDQAGSFVAAVGGRHIRS